MDFSKIVEFNRVEIFVLLNVICVILNELNIFIEQIPINKYVKIYIKI